MRQSDSDAETSSRSGSEDGSEDEFGDLGEPTAGSGDSSSAEEAAAAGGSPEWSDDANSDAVGDQPEELDVPDASADGASEPGEGEAAAAAIQGPFRSKEKGAAIAKAFAKVTHGAREDTTGARMLSGSKSVLKRQREEAAAEGVDKQARQLRQEMKQRGHVRVPRRGENPEQDAAEKLLLRTARRGVVRLFNAVSKAQKQHVEHQAVGGKAKAKQLSKADFLEELRGASKKPAVASSHPGARAPAAIGVSAAEQAAAPDQPSWAPLQDEDAFASLRSGLKMKDWDKVEAADEAVAETMADISGSDSE